MNFVRCLAVSSRLHDQPTTNRMQRFNTVTKGKRHYIANTLLCLHFLLGIFQRSFCDQITTTEDAAHVSNATTVLSSFKTEDLWRNEKFLSDLLNIVVANEPRDQLPRDENQ